MAGWITHSCIADALFERGLNVDIEHFSIGNIAPDCNVENEDWSAFTPPREVTHWMHEKNKKLTADYEAFYTQYVENRTGLTRKEHSFLLGYYAHLIADVEAQRVLRDPDRVKAIFSRIAAIPEMQCRITGLPADMDTLKTVFGKKRAVSSDLAYMENRYALKNPNSVYNTVVRTITDFPNYLDYLPAGAIPRKIRIMANAPDPSMEKPEFIFYAEEEYTAYIQHTTELIYNKLLEKFNTYPFDL